MAKRFGVPEEKIAAIADWRTQPGFTEAERAALALGEEITRHGGRVAEATWAEAARHFAEGELVELVATAGAFNAFNRMANAMQVEVTR